MADEITTYLEDEKGPARSSTDMRTELNIILNAKSNRFSETNKEKVYTKRVEVRLKSLEVSDLIKMSHESGKTHNQVVNLIVQLIHLAKVDSCCEVLTKIGRLNTIFDIVVQLKEMNANELCDKWISEAFK